MTDRDNNFEQLCRDLSSGRVRLDDRKEQSANLEAELIGRNEQINKLQRDLTDAREHAAGLDQKVAAFMQSSSWKITAPLHSNE